MHSNILTVVTKGLTKYEKDCIKMKEKSHEAQIAILQKKIEMLEQKSSASASMRKEKKKRSSKNKAETKQVQDVNKNTDKGSSRFDEPEVPVLEQALEELLSSNKDEFSKSEVEEFYTRLGCDSESVQVSFVIDDYCLIYDY